MTIASSSRAKQAAELGLEIESGPDSERCIVYFTPNQIFFMLTAYRIFALKKAGLLTRDPREKERKKYGLKRARKAPQYTKR